MHINILTAIFFFKGKKQEKSIQQQWNSQIFMLNI